MKFVTEPDILTKIHKMQQRVCWDHPFKVQRGIDQTRLVLADGGETDEAFAFLVLGDSGTGRHRRDNPQRRVAETVLAHREDARFVLHTGDVVYLVGSSEHYRENFIRPYREFLVNGADPRHIAYDRMVFQTPVLPVLGNHDYYDLKRLLGLAAGLTGPLRYLLRSHIDLDVGWHGSFQGDAFARAFLDYLKAIPEAQLGSHLDAHYGADSDTGRCLKYEPGCFTRLPNRYYTFRYGGIDFFGLDSNTFNQPAPLPNTASGRAQRQALRDHRQALERRKRDLLTSLVGMNLQPDQDDDLQEDIYGELEQLDEQIYDTDKQLSSTTGAVDFTQLDWLQQRLVQSWQNPEVRGRILFFHHPPYVTEATKWGQAQTLAVRHHLRRVLDAVAEQVGDQRSGRPVVDLVLCGHAHCLEYLRTGDTGRGDAHIPWLICGGSGYSLRRQRREGNELTESDGGDPERERVVARSQLFLGRSGHGSHKRRPYSALRIEVQPGTPPRFRVYPLVAEKFHGDWSQSAHAPICLHASDNQG